MLAADDGSSDEPKVKPRGNPKGVNHRAGLKNRKTIARQETLQSAYEHAFARYSEAEIDQMTPKTIFQVMTLAALKAKMYPEAHAAAREWAPYVDARLAPRVVDMPADPSGSVTEIIEIIGGTPKRRQFEIDRDDAVH
ncbi:hypothetical protein [Acidisoma sp. S159]|uniref:hypothetical protein n=1 Tax=Acidisoma sp. S159 TaxID=1747225 RepID=UPI00131C818B|nr:hypothetical protein [Acidisoma sp. S159]